jgi:glycosyltransferase involved in cell wall biosynthesis
VVFAGRWIQIKRPELFFRISKQFPDVQFISMGKAESSRRDAQLRCKYGAIVNLDIMGWVDQFRSSHFQEILSKSWILINADLRGALSVAFVEAASFGCAILSSINPDGFASRFGYWARMGDFAEGLRFLLNDDKWRYRGEQAYEYVKRFNDINIVTDEYIRIYRTLLDREIR